MQIHVADPLSIHIYSTLDNFSCSSSTDLISGTTTLTPNTFNAFFENPRLAKCTGDWASPRHLIRKVCVLGSWSFAQFWTHWSLLHFRIFAMDNWISFFLPIYMAIKFVYRSCIACFIIFFFLFLFLCFLSICFLFFFFW